MLLLLICCCTLGFTQDQEHHEHQSYRPNIEPKYSRSTPFQNEESLPKPVFGMAHGFPYKSLKKDDDRDVDRDHSQSLRRGRLDLEGDHEQRGEPPEELRPPYFIPKMEDSSANRKLRQSGIGEVHSQEERQPQPRDGSDEDDRMFPLPPWLDIKVSPLKGKTPRNRNSYERNDSGLRQQLVNGVPSQKEIPSSHEENFFGPGQPSISNSEPEHGGGFKSRPSVGAGSQSSGEVDQKFSEEEKKEATDHQSNRDFVDVNVQAVTDVQPENRGLGPFGRFIPLSDWKLKQSRLLPPLSAKRRLRKKLRRRFRFPIIEEQNEVQNREINSEETSTKHYGDLNVYSETPRDASYEGETSPQTQQPAALIPVEGIVSQASEEQPINSPKRLRHFEEEVHQFTTRSSEELSDQGELTRTTAPIMKAPRFEKQPGGLEQRNIPSLGNRLFNVDMQVDEQDEGKRMHGRSQGCSDEHVTDEPSFPFKEPCADCSQISSPQSISIPSTKPSQRAIDSVVEKSIVLPSSLSPSPSSTPPSVSTARKEQTNSNGISKNKHVDCRGGTESRDTVPIPSNTPSLSVSAVQNVSASLLFTTTNPLSHPGPVPTSPSNFPCSSDFLS
ncbi:hypothetical protein V3C99_014437 [Haemonchus contortus]|uniref:Trichohyalin-like n=1 Tax=Haemonchus contortus TaxID=6289 RepID=A0A7I4YT20_HAECO